MGHRVARRLSSGARQFTPSRRGSEFPVIPTHAIRRGIAVPWTGLRPGTWARISLRIRFTPTGAANGLNGLHLFLQGSNPVRILFHVGFRRRLRGLRDPRGGGLCRVHDQVRRISQPV